MAKGDETLIERQCQNWFAKFRSGDFPLKNEERSGRPLEVNDEQIKALIDYDRHSSTKDIVKKLDVSHTCVKNCLRRLGCQKKLYALLWGTLARKEAPTTSLNDIHQKKVLLSFWWDYKGIVYFELLPRNQIINSEVYIRQLTNLNDTIQEKRSELANSKEIVFHHDNARPSPSLATGQKLLELGWNVLLHPPYSPKLAPNNYHFFRFLKNFLNGEKFQNDNEVKTALEQFFAPKTKEFYEKRKMILPKKCQKVTNNNGHNIIHKNNFA
ncbi:mariner transposase, putative [Pediculus humanus corporis]|uniref:Mariner transposase, putative n=1 Tax=Pediculus humanus subsp. corporis TaxID=121224 RepID=E0V9P9_PEDHC|nr:mariner transposase, putative [Pediculus humanus corporis]EEB10084.1 mariner transposase, putative [Pediculus humanus corporis]